MPTLPNRGNDCVNEFEAAARQRYADARQLGAVYRYGYSVEMRVKALYFRAAGFTARQVITAADRKDATHMYLTLGLIAEPKQHDLYGWANLAVGARETTVRPLSATLGQDILTRAASFALMWSEVLRYRSTVPTAQEARDAERIAEWFGGNYGRMV